MKSIKLKALYLKADEILIQPPVELAQTLDYSLPANSNMTISSIDNLSSILRGRSLKLKTKKPELLQEEKESVEKLSHFRAKIKKITKSPVRNRFVYKRTLSNISVENGSTKQSPVKEPPPTIENLIRSISSREKGYVKTLESELQRHTEGNKNIEANLISQRKEKESQIKSINRQIFEVKSDISKSEKLQKNIQDEYQEKISEIAFQNTEGLLSSYTINGKKKNGLDITEEHEYLHLKQKLRKLKEDLHTAFIDNTERLSERLETQKSTLDSLQILKNEVQKESKEIQETLQAFYCRALKDGMDLREDGLRWCIKAIWKTAHPVPVSSFPKYLDEVSVTFLLKLAQIDLEIKSLTAELQILRNDFKRENMYTSFEKNNFEVMKSVKQRLKVLSQTSKVIKAKGEVQGEAEKKNFGMMEHAPDLCEIKEKIKEKEMMKNRLSEVEIRRVVEGYKGDENVGILHIVKALVGDKTKDFRVLAQHRKLSFLKTLINN